MTREGWTVDRIHHALPHSALRQQLLQDVNLTPIDELPAVLERWAAAAVTLMEMGPRIQVVREAGRLPEGLVVEDRTGEVLRDAGRRPACQEQRDGRGRGAA